MLKIILCGCLALTGVGVGVFSPVVVAAQDEVSPRDEQRARQLFEAARTAFSEGRFPDALRDFERAYELSQLPGLLFNVGTTADRLRMDGKALEAFEAYLKALPEAPNRLEVEARIEAIRGAIAQREAERAEAQAAGAGDSGTEADAPPPAHEGTPEGPEIAESNPLPPKKTDWLAWGLVGGGAAVALGGGAALALGMMDSNEVENPDPGTRWEDAESTYDGARLKTMLGFGLIGAGVITAGLGVWFLMDSGEGDAGLTAVRFGPSGLAVEGTF